MSDIKNENPKTESTSKWSEYNWPKVLFQLHIHIFFAYSLVFLFRVKLATLAFSILLTAFSVLGATAGAHRLWAHRSYSANSCLRFFLMICHTVGGSGPIYDWVLDHRIHHKFESTKDDPYNRQRGFFYSHIGHHMCQSNPRRQEILKEIDITDLENDKIVMFQKRFYYPLAAVLCLLLPINAPVEYWGEDMLNSLMVVGLFRIPLTLHATWLINSARLIWDLEPNDRFFSDSNLIFIITKSHWHSYHYTAPWDCLTGEFGSYNYGSTTVFLKICAALGLATDLKTVSSKMMIAALERSVNSGESIQDCLLQVKKEEEMSKYDDCSLDIIQSSPYS